MFPFTLVGSSPKLVGDSRWNNARQIESVDWEEIQSWAFSQVSPFILENEDLSVSG